MRGPGGSGRAVALFPSLRLPRRPDGTVDRARVRHLATAGAPPAIAFLGLAYLALVGVGRGAPDFIIALVTTLPLYVTARAWRLPWWLHLGVGSLPLSLAVVAAVHANATGLSRAARLAYGALLFLGLTGWASTARRRRALGLLVALLGVEVLFFSLVTWVIGGNPQQVVAGTLGWHNQFAILEVAALTHGAFLTVLARGRVAILAGIAAALAGTGVVLSGSRFGTALGGAALLAAVAAGLIAARRPARTGRRWAGLLRLAVVLAVMLLLPLLLRSPLLFPKQATGDANPLVAVTARGSLDSSWTSRLEFWRAALGMGADHPIAGVGLDRYAQEAVCYGVAKPLWHPHDEWLFAWAEGGIIELLPMLLLVAGVVLLLVRSLRPLPGGLALRGDPTRWAGLVALVAGIADLVVEYDLAYLVLEGLLACAAAAATAPLLAPTLAAPTRRRDGTVAVLIVAATLVTAALGIALDPRVGFDPWMGPIPLVCGLTFY